MIWDYILSFEHVKTDKNAWLILPRVQFPQGITVVDFAAFDHKDNTQIFGTSLQISVKSMSSETIHGLIGQTVRTPMIATVHQIWENGQFATLLGRPTRQSDLKFAGPKKPDWKKIIKKQHPAVVLLKELIRNRKPGDYNTPVIEIPDPLPNFKPKNTMKSINLHTTRIPTTTIIAKEQKSAECVKPFSITPCKIDSINDQKTRPTKTKKYKKRKRRELLRSEKRQKSSNPSRIYVHRKLVKSLNYNSMINSLLMVLLSSNDFYDVINSNNIQHET